VGCATPVHTVGGKIVNIEGHPRSPDNEDTLCPRGAASPISTVGYGAAWLRAFLNRAASGLDFDESQAAQVAVLAEDKLADPFDVAREAAPSNGRARVLCHDLPLTRGLSAQVAEAERLARELELSSRSSSPRT